MSADNYIVIRRDADRKYRGYMATASEEPGTWEQFPTGLEADTLADAFLLAQEINTEYGAEYVGDVADYYVI